MNAHLNESINRFKQIFPLMVPELANSEIAVIKGNNYIAELAFKDQPKTSYENFINKLKMEADFILFTKGKAKNLKESFDVAILFSRPEQNYFNVIKVVSTDGQKVSQLFVSVYTSIELMTDDLFKVQNTFSTNFSVDYAMNSQYFSKLMTLA